MTSHAPLPPKTLDALKAAINGLALRYPVRTAGEPLSSHEQQPGQRPTMMIVGDDVIALRYEGVGRVAGRSLTGLFTTLDGAKCLVGVEYGGTIFWAENSGMSSGELVIAIGADPPQVRPLSGAAGEAKN